MCRDRRGKSGGGRHAPALRSHHCGRRSGIYSQPKKIFLCKCFLAAATQLPPVHLYRHLTTTFRTTSIIRPHNEKFDRVACNLAHSGFFASKYDASLILWPSDSRSAPRQSARHQQTLAITSPPHTRTIRTWTRGGTIREVRLILTAMRHCASRLAAPMPLTRHRLALS